MASELIRRVEDLLKRAVRTNQAAATSFLDPAELNAALAFLRTQPGARYFARGGFDDAERQRIMFLPDYFDEDTFPVEDYITALRADCPFGAPGHRDWLGSLMGLGVKREALGDILVCDGYADIICTRQIAAFVADNLIKVGRFGVSVREIDLCEIVPPVPEFEKRGGTVASLRADAVTGLAFGMSRTEATRLIREGRLAVNHTEQLSPSAEIEEGDLLSLRGFGRARLAKVGGTSKKGRVFLEIHAYTRK